MRRAPIDDVRAAQAADRLEAASAGDHAARAGTPGATYLERLAATKLGELLDETGGILGAGDPDLEAAFAHDLELEAARWGPDPEIP